MGDATVVRVKVWEWTCVKVQARTLRTLSISQYNLSEKSFDYKKSLQTFWFSNSSVVIFSLGSIKDVDKEFCHNLSRILGKELGELIMIAFIIVNMGCWAR